MQSWLLAHGIAYEASGLKADLMSKITDAKPTKQFETDLIAEKFTHRVLRLPVAHPELNPIELAWSVVKGYVAKHNKFTSKEIEELVPQGISQVTPQIWKKNV
jgi:transposase